MSWTEPSDIGGCLKVADFGLSRVLSAEAVSTGTYGTVTHMPIELLTTGAHLPQLALPVWWGTFSAGQTGVATPAGLLPQPFVPDSASGRSSPETLQRAGKLSKAADVYAFGVILWEMLTGQRPWAGLLQMQVSACA